MPVRRPTAFAVALLSIALSDARGAHAQIIAAQPPETIGGVSASASGPSTAADAAAPQTAAQYAPSRPLITEEQPESVIGPETLDKLAIPTENYDDIVALTPSAMDLDPAGPGLQQDFGQSIRGLQYTQFSVLYDGVQVPGTPSSLAPQPAAYFMEHDIGSIAVNRGPGLASDIGSATFGGFVALSSPTLSSTPSIEPYGTFGSFGTKLYGIELESGAVGPLDGARVSLDLSHEEAEGADTGLATERRNLFLKYEQPVGENTLVTALVNLDNADNHTTYGVTQQLADSAGRNYALNNDPTSQTFEGYNRDDYTTDFEYLRVQSRLGDGFGLDNTTYTAGYDHRGTEGLDPDGTTPNLVDQDIDINGVRTFVQDDVPGTADKNDTRDEGDILRLTYDTPSGQARTGVWFDHIDNTTYRYAVDFTRGTVAYTTSPTGTPYSYIVFDTLTTVQPYWEYEWRPTRTVTVTAGVRYDAVTRSLQAPINRTTKLDADDHEAFNKPLPALSANWRVRPYLALYAQAAGGYLTPPLNVFYTTSITSVEPSTSWNFQVGEVFQRRWLDLGADLYYIKYGDYITSQTIAGQALYFNSGGAEFKGVEAEGTAKLGWGFALYANGSLNDSNYTDNSNNLAQTPRRTGALGLIYDQGTVFRSHDDLHGLIIAKNVGPQYGEDTATPGKGDQFPIKSYNVVDLDAGYVLPVAKRRLSFDVQVYNLFDDRSFIGIDGTDAAGQALYWVDPGRSIFFSFAAKL